MRAVVCALLTVAVGHVAALDLSSENAEWRMHPVQKVIKLLTEMQAQLEKEAASDDEIMDKMVCWCETNDKGKTKAIADAEALIAQLQSTIEEKTAAIGGAKDEIAGLEADVAENTQELEKATAIREKENAEFTQSEADTKTSLGGLTKALAAMEGKVGAASLLQVKQELRLRLGKTGASIPPQVTSFLQTDARLQQKAPSGGEVLGVLKQMKDNFAENLRESQADEASAVKAYEEMKAAKTQELQAAQNMIESKTKESAEATETLAQAKADLEDTSNQLEVDTKFLADLKERCGNMDAEFAERKKMRNEEITAVGEALSILTSDDSKDQFSKSLGFLQTSKSVQRHATGSTMRRVRTRAARLFLEAGVRLGSPKLSMLALAIRNDVFAKIKTAIDEMLVQLKQEQKDEVKHKDWCIQELHQNEMQTEEADDEKKALATSLEEMTLLVENVDEELAASKAQVADTLVEIKKASENREKENKDFQMTIQDQKATQAILEKVLTKLQAVYAKKAALLQAKARTARAGQAPPPGFGGPRTKNGGGSAVVMMIQGIIKESKTVETEATAAEQEAQAAYDEFIKNSNASIENLHRGMSEKKEAAAKADGEIARAKADQKANGASLDELAAYNTELHGDCDFVLKNFEVRQNSRTAEMEALNQGKAILSGANI